MNSTSEGRLPDHDHPTPATDSTPTPGHSRTYRILRGVLEFLAELIGEFLAEIVVQLVSCALLIGVVFGLFWGWGRSPGLTLSAVAVLLTGTVGTVAARKARSRPDRRWPWLVGSSVLTIVCAVAVWFLLYGSNCGCT
ncbi:hypothetical protein [Streptomyces sp. NPDC059994]|uniref:hypothetical protein n=1 Tax=Streptomyces sp. NPDC059994 TaxID=3347029 RepID=UPI0036B2A387